MYAIHPYVAQQLAHEYTRDRLHRAEAARMARRFRAATRRGADTTAVAPTRRRMSWSLRPRTA